MILAGLLTRYQLFQTREASERIDDNLTHIAISTQVELTFRDVTRVIRHRMGNITSRKGRHGDNRDRSTCGELHRLLVNLRQIGVKRTRHRVLGWNLVHTVGDNRQGIGVVGHIGQQDEHLLVLLHSEILCSCQGHIRNQDTLHRGILCRIDEADDTIQGTCVAEGILEEEVIVIGHTHTT